MMMNHYNLFKQLKDHYSSLNPHHDTWVLWTKDGKTKQEFFEVAIGTILVQNTNWKNVDQAIANLHAKNINTFEQIYSCNDQILIELIKPAGFFNQKMMYLKTLSKLFIDFKEESITRQILLKTKGIGKETADSILNFCLRRPIPVIGTYTKRLLARVTGDTKYLSKQYEFIQEEVLTTFEKPSAYGLGLYHALIVAHSQNLCTKVSPNCSKCFLDQCQYKKSQNEGSELFMEIDTKINPPKRKKGKLP